MSQTKFIKGEWVVNSISGELWVDCGKLCVAKVIGGELALPEANLIAAAPDMYAALEAMSKGEGLQPGTTIESILLKARGE